MTQTTIHAPPNNGINPSTLDATEFGDSWYNAMTAIQANFTDLYGILTGAIGGFINASAAEINRVAQVATRLVSATASSLTVTAALHEGRTVALNRATGVAVALPAATGTGNRFRFVVGTATSGGSQTISTVPTTDIFKGVVYGSDDDGVPANSWAASTNSNVFTMDGSTQGGKVGDYVEIEDIAAGVWAIKASLTQSGTEATPFSHV